MPQSLEYWKSKLPPTLAEVGANFTVNWADAKNVAWLPQYDYTQYPIAGMAATSFFQIAKGGVDPTTGLQKTLHDTNMVGAGGQISKPKTFLAMGVQFRFFSGAPAVQFGSTYAVGAKNQAADLEAIRQSGYLQFKIGDKVCAGEAPLDLFMGGQPVPKVDVETTDTTTAGAANFSVLAQATIAGNEYEITPVQIPENQNFTVDVNWFEGAVAMPSGAKARIGARLLGFLWQPVQ